MEVKLASNTVYTKISANTGLFIGREIARERADEGEDSSI